MAERALMTESRHQGGDVQQRPSSVQTVKQPETAAPKKRINAERLQDCPLHPYMARQRLDVYQGRRQLFGFRGAQCVRI
jgi:hypothetical protein